MCVGTPHTNLPPPTLVHSPCHWQQQQQLLRAIMAHGRWTPHPGNAWLWKSPGCCMRWPPAPPSRAPRTPSESRVTRGEPHRTELVAWLHSLMSCVDPRIPLGQQGMGPSQPGYTAWGSPPLLAESWDVHMAAGMGASLLPLSLPPLCAATSQILGAVHKPQEVTWVQAPSFHQPGLHNPAALPHPPRAATSPGPGAGPVPLPCLLSRVQEEKPMETREAEKAPGLL